MKKKLKSNQQKWGKGFTLVELSIVLVIIGLLVGGIMVGKSLINAAEIQRASSQLMMFKTIFNTFQLKYNCEAGDCTRATDFFGINYVSCPGMTNGDGNGNGMIDHGGSPNWYCEGLAGVTSLKLANLMPSETQYESMKGIHDSLAFLYNDDISSSYPERNKSTISWTTEVLGFARGGAFSPMEGLAIDTKIDDGKPDTGKFVGLDTAPVGSGVIVANTCSTGGAYNNNETRTCRSIFYYQ